MTPPLLPSAEPPSVEQLGEAIANIAAGIHAATYQLLVLLREFDERSGWNNGFLSCAQRTGIDMDAERRRAARPDYAVFARHPQRTKDDPVDPTDPQRTQRVGTLKPNPLGLFDVYGNVWEWTQDRVERFQYADVREDREDTVLRVLDSDARTRRGGAFSYGAAFARSAARGPVTSLPTNRRDNVGFRIARTVR